MSIKHYLYDENDKLIESFNEFDADKIKTATIKFLTENPNGMVEHCKDPSPEDRKKFWGKESINAYEVNTATKQICKIVVKGNKIYYKPITI
jgi:hypothetical protein